MDRLPGLMPLPGRAGPARRRNRSAAWIVCAVVGLAVALAGCAGQEQSGTPAHRVTTWMTGGGGGSGIGNVEVDSRNIDLALSRHNKPAAIREVCDLLSNDAQTAIGDLPAPDDQLTTELNAAYMVATSAGGDCFNGADGNVRLLARSASERTHLASLLAVAVAHVESVTGRTPTTDTTAPQGGGDPFSGGT